MKTQKKTMFYQEQMMRNNRMSILVPVLTSLSLTASIIYLDDRPRVVRLIEKDP